MRRRGKPAKVSVKGKRPPAPRSSKTEDTRVRDLEQHLAEARRREAEASMRESEALEQQTATSEILRVISRSPTDVQPTFEAIAASARRLCEAAHGLVFRFDGELIHLAAHDNLSRDRLDAIRSVFPIPPGPGSVTARAILTRALVHVRDRREDPELRYSVLSANFPNTLSVPLLRDGVPLGAITVTRAEIGPFSDRQITLLQTFADQAVIAIENVRLFTELQEKNRALTEAHAQVTEALDQQTATSEILRVISSSPTDVQPAFSAIADSAARLTGAVVATLYEYDGQLVHLRALSPSTYRHADQFRELFPRPLAPDFAAGHVILERAVLHVADLLTDPATPPASRQWAEWLQIRGVLWVPLLREGEPIGVIGVVRAEAGRFSDEQVRLLQTFADQAVIGVENVRLFNETKESLEQQTATSKILRVISQSLTDIQPVLDAVAASAARLCEAFDAAIWRRDGDRVVLVAHHGSMPEEPIGKFSPRSSEASWADRYSTGGLSTHVTCKPKWKHSQRPVNTRGA
jgi:two-component system, NtrC family, sensor kinase